MKIQEKTSALSKEVKTGKKELILFNDNHNTFEHVIDCLVSICGHNVLQAEQCAYITHHVGKSSIKQGTLDQLKPLHTALQLQQLSVGIK